MAKKILGVDNLDVIRDFVLSKVMSESDDIKRVLTEENAAYLQKKLLEAAESLKKDYESKYDNLYEQLEKLKQGGADIEAIKELELRIDALNNNYIDQHNSLKRIEDSIADIGDSVMSPGQLNELINTALIEKTTITDDMIETPNLYTKNLVALIAKFGTVRALNIIGDEIEGKTLSAYDKIPGTNDPTWKLQRDGDGYLAGKNIVWDKNGNVTFGDKVKIKWGSVTDTPDDFGSGTSVFTSTVFKRTNTKPSKPTGGSFSNPTPDDTTWTDGIPDGSEILWAATRVFASDGGHRQQAEWTGPSQMTDTETFDVEFSSVEVNPGNPTDNPNNWKNEGDSSTIWMATATIANGVKSAWTITKIKGEDGTDGVGVFKSTVFKRTNTILTAADKPVGGSFSNPIPTGWSDGIPSGEEILWASTATFSSDGSKDVDWSTPAQMTDTHDFEIIYSSKETPAAPGGNFAKDADGEITEWLKSNPDWTDDGVESSIWMATIKAANGVWGDWSVTKIKGEKGEDGTNGVDGIDGKDGTSISIAGYFDTEEELWAAFPDGPDPVTNAYVVNGDLYVWASGSWKNVGKFTGNDGVSTFKSTVFKRTNSTPSKPTGGSYANPTPQGWSDGIPTGEEILWASTATFSSDGSKDVDWSTPAQMTDTHDFEVIYSGTDFASKSKALASIPAGFKKNGVDIDPDWLSKATNWTDDGQDGSVWMATIKSSNGVWGDWTVSKIKGESGKDGQDGTDGAQVYLHIKYAESVSFDMSGNVSQVALTGNNGENKGPWQGMYSDYTEADSNDVKKYKWFQIDAEKAVQTEFGKYNITSNTIVGKTMYSTTSLPLANETEYITFDGDGLETGKVTSDGTKIGPAWQIKNHGDGYLAAGNIRWDSSGNLLVNGKINGNIASESGDTVGPWKVSKVGTTTTIHDGNTQTTSKTYFSSDNSFRIGGTQGIRGSNALGISIGNTSGGKGISVGTDGTVTFGDNVSLKWGNVTDKPSDLGGLTEGDVTKIIGTTITKDYVESLKVRATDIIGDTITGKTIKSSGDKWYIGKDGDGKLANGNITWDANGGVTFGSGVKLNWSTNINDDSGLSSNISAAAAAAAAAQSTADTAKSTADTAKSTANTAKSTADTAKSTAETVSSTLSALQTRVNQLNNYSEDQIKAFATTITNDTVTTAFVNALGITADSVAAEKITGNTIQGKTIKNTNGTWEINNDGSGKLASNKINWNSDGSGNISNLLTWDKNGNPLGNNLSPVAQLEQTVGAYQPVLYITQHLHLILGQPQEGYTSLFFPQFPSLPTNYTGYIASITCHNVGTGNGGEEVQIRTDRNNSNKVTTIQVPDMSAMTIHYFKGPSGTIFCTVQR